MEIGIKLKEMRLSLGLTQEELADRCELTKGYISQLENDLTSPSISTLGDILSALGSDLQDFFKEGKDERIVFKKEDFIVKENDSGQLTWLVPNAQKNTMEPVTLLLKGGLATEEDMPHEGEEFGYVLKGEILICVGEKKIRVKEGEAFYYSADKTHSIINAKKSESEIIWVSSPPNF